jgi:hypothetical protein
MPLPSSYAKWSRYFQGKMRMRHVTSLLALVLVGFGAKATPSDEKHFTADGVVVAVQKTKDEARMYDPHSMGDLVEVWMVRVDKWTRSERPTFILVEYTHRDAILKDGELDSTEWRFDIRPAPPAKSGTCMSWWTQTFIPTALGANQKLPPPRELGCFLMQKRPVALRHTKAENER